MGKSLIVLAAILAAILNADDQVSLVRQNEANLRRAVIAKNQAILDRLLGSGFTFHVDDVRSTEHNASADVSREEWISGLLRLRVESYEEEISKIEVQRELATVELVEYLTILSPQGRRIEKRLNTRDTWLKRPGASDWKLASRLWLVTP